MKIRIQLKNAKQIRFGRSSVPILPLKIPQRPWFADLDKFRTFVFEGVFHGLTMSFQ